MLSSCMSSEDSPGLDGLQSSTVIGRELAAVAPGSDATQERQAEPDPVQVANLRNPLDFETTANASVRSSDAIAETNGTSANGWRVLLRPFYNENARDLMDHWGRREIKGISAVVLEPDPETDVSGLLTMLAAARASGTEPVVSALHDGDAVTPIGRASGVRYGRWTGGPADTLSIEFDYDHAGYAIRLDDEFQAALNRAGKVWSWRIEDTWQAWERERGESKVWLIGDYGSDRREIRVSYGGETSTGLVIYVTGAELRGDSAASARIGSRRPGDDWQPHVGTIVFDNDFVEDAGEALAFAAMVHEIGHVLGAWRGDDVTERYAPFSDVEDGTWTGSHVVAVYGGPAPFQDRDDEHGWHDGERSASADNFDFAHSGVCSSVMAYCSDSAAVPAFLPAEIDFAFLRDLGLTIRAGSERPETYGVVGWMDQAGFSVAVFRELEVSLADPPPRYFNSDAGWQDLDTVDFVWAEVDVFGNRSTGMVADSYPLSETVRYAGGMIGVAVLYAGLPPVYGNANLEVDLESMDGKASFTSLEMTYGGERHVFGEGRLHYPIVVSQGGIRDDLPGVSLVADFFGPAHEEVAGTLDDSREGLVASFGARHDDRRTWHDVVSGADHVRGMTYQSPFDGDEVQEGWFRYRCGAGSDCEGIYRWWEDGRDWYSIGSFGEFSPRERVLDWTVGWGPWISEELHADYGNIRVVRRYEGDTDGGTGRYQADGYFGTMEYAAFGTKFSRFDDWNWANGDVSNFHGWGTGFQGDRSGTRPTERATWEGLMLGYQAGLEPGEDPFVQGHARVDVSLYRNTVDVDFSGIRSLDGERRVFGFGYDDIGLLEDGSFAGFDDGRMEGAFFGSAHEEVAGMFHNNARSVTGSFGAVR